ncbi:MAG TPA: porin [Geobacteraceae bacterium]
MKKLWTMIAAAALLCAAAAPSRAASLEELQKQIDDLNGQMKALSEKEAATAAVAAKTEESYLKKTWDKTRIGGYGELDYVFRKENGNGNGGNTFEPRRAVLYVNSELADWLTLNTELEWEHGGVPDGGPDAGVSVEQAFLDFKLARPFNIKAGVMLVPVGAINLYHEPTSFNSTTRPELDQIIIPTTWQEMGAGIHGALGDKADYQLLVMTGLDGTRFSAENGIREGRQNFGKDSNRSQAVTGRIELRPYTNLYANLSFYTCNAAPSGKPAAYTTVAAFDGKYSLGAFDIAGEYARVYQDNPAGLGISDIGHNMSGYWVEGAYHFMPKSLKQGKLAEADAVLFARWSEFTTQDGGAIDPAMVSGRFDRNYTTFGIAFKPVTQMVIKADYQIYGDHRTAGEIPLDNDKFQVTLGYVF